MLPLIQRCRRSISFRTLLQALAIECAALIIVTLILGYYMDTHISREISKRADTLVHSLETTTGIHGFTPDLARTIDSLGHEPDVHTIIVTMRMKDEVPTIIASNDENLLGKSTDQLADINIRERILSAYASQEFFATITAMIITRLFGPYSFLPAISSATNMASSISPLTRRPFMPDSTGT